MTFKTAALADMDAFFNEDEHAQTVTYNDADITAVADVGQRISKQTGSVVDECKLYVQVSDVSSPAYRDTVLIGSDTWRVRRVLSGDGYTWTLSLERDERPIP